MSDRPAKGRLPGRSLGIHVDELMIQRHVGEGVHTRLIDFKPVGGMGLADASGIDV